MGSLATRPASSGWKGAGTGGIVRACRCLTALHSTPLRSHRQMLLSPPALLRLMNRRRVPESKHAGRQVSSQLAHLACAACRRRRRKNTHVHARTCRHVSDEFNPVTHTSPRQPCAVLSTCVTFPMRCALNTVASQTLHYSAGGWSN